MAAFTTKSLTQNQCSPFTPPNHRSKSASYGGYGGTRHARTLDSNIVLSTLGSIPPDMSLEQDVVEMENIRLGLGMDLGSLSTAVGGDDGEPLADESGLSGLRDDVSQAPSHSSRSPAPAYRTLEMGFRPNRTPSLSDGVRGIRVDVEKATATM